MVVALHDVQRIGGDVLARDEPGVAAAVALATDTQALALSQGVEGKAHVLAHGPAVGRADRAGLRRQVAIEKLAKRPLADEADPGRVALGGIGQADAPGDRPHLALG